MATRLGLSRNGPPLLKTVGGKPHAGNQHHEEAPQKEDTPVQPLSLAEQEEIGIWDEPLSSGDETPSNATPKTDTKSAALTHPTSTRKRKAPLALSAPEPALNKPAKTRARVAAPRVPKMGQYEQSRTAKNGVEGAKENSTVKQTPPPSSSRDIWGFGVLSQPSAGKGKKVKFGGTRKTANIHAQPATKTNRRPAEAASKLNRNTAHTWDLNADSDSDISMLDDQELERLGASVALDQQKPEELHDPELRKIEPKKRRVRVKDEAPESSALNESELDDILKPTLRDHLGHPKSETAPDSSLPDSSVPQEDIDNIDSYMRELPAEAEEGTACAICNEPVHQEDYWLFWKGRKKTVRNQAAFCHTHKKKTAQAEYDAENYPPINWTALPSRIKTHRMALHRILTNDLPSPYRTRYAPLALTGKAAAVPSKRTDLPSTQQAKLESYALDDNSVYPGYYGPRGRRLITESVMKMLSNEIKKCSDPVVQTSGPATFVQAVLVPEVAIRLIMEDRMCDEDEAEHVRERTYEMGLLLNEEIEDSVDVGEESERENDYHDYK